MPDIVMPRLSESMTEGKLLRWSVTEGARVREGDIIAEVETDKANMEIETLEAGFVRSLKAFPGDMVPVGAVIAVLEVERGGSAPNMIDDDPAGARTPPPAYRSVNASPLAMSIAEERGVDLSKVRGTGRAGRITKEDVLAHIADHGEVSAPAGSWTDSHDIGGAMDGMDTMHALDTPGDSARGTYEEAGDIDDAGPGHPGGRLPPADDSWEDEIVPPPMDSTASVIPIGADSTVEELDEGTVPPEDGFEEPFAGQMSEPGGAELVVLGGLATMHVAAVADVTSLLASLPSIRERLPAGFRGISAGQFLGAVVAKAGARAVEDCPLGEKEDEVGITDICISVQSGDDFAWHVLSDPRATSLQQMCVEILSAEADPDADAEPDVPVCAFAIMNLGRFGADDFSGVIGEDEVPVLAVGAALESPRLRDGQWVNAQTVRISLSATASEIRPAAAARFLGRVRELMEHPVLLAGF